MSRTRQFDPHPDVAGRTPGALLNQVAWGAGSDRALSGLGLMHAALLLMAMAAVALALAAWLFERRSIRA